jgi:hypothetical protein
MSLFRASLQHNDSYAFREYPFLTERQRIHQELVPDMSGQARTSVQRCETCGELLAKWDEPLSGLLIKRRKFDIAITYDGVLVVSQRFKSCYEISGLSGLVFRQLPDDPEFFAVHASRSVEFDADRRKTQFIKRCHKCGCYESVVGATPVYLKPGVEIGGPEFVRTDLEFGSRDEKHPLLLCGEIAAKAASRTDLKGLDLVRVDPSVS